MRKSGSTGIDKVILKHLTAEPGIQFQLTITRPSDMGAGDRLAHECSLTILTASGEEIEDGIEFDHCIECPAGSDVLDYVTLHGSLKVTFKPHEEGGNLASNLDVVEFTLTVDSVVTVVNWRAMDLQGHFDYDRDGAFREIESGSEEQVFGDE
ncbi:hypothetical protein FJZ48_01565 [Candidatus Uhrbacteria bacterium]|nr:hypothetical protein [Candidatus Uhrbacteria bacterium]